MRKITFLKTMLMTIVLFVGSVNAWGQGTETFSHSSSSSSYGTINWTGTNGLSWTSTDSRGDQVINTGDKAITVRVGAITGNLTSGQQIAGIGTLSFDYKIPYSDATKNITATITAGSKVVPFNIGLLTVGEVKNSGNITINSDDATQIVIAISSVASGARLTIDNLVWTAYSSSCATSSLAFASSPVEKLVTDAKFTITPTTNSTGAITYLSSVETVATVDPATGEVTIVGAGSTEITANQVADATYCANSVKYTLNVASAAPTITITEVTAPAFSAQIGETDSETINISGSNLTADIILTIDGANADMFTVNSPLPSTGGVATIVYTPSSPGTHTATLKLNSTGAAEEARTLNGTAYVPVVSGAVIISEVFGGGGNSGAALKNDFIELYNTTSESITIGGWSVQYFSATNIGEATNVFVIPEGRFIPSGAHFLIKASAGAGGTLDITDQDATSTLSLGGTAGKIILYNTSAAQTISDIASITGNPNFVDYVPYGTTAVPVWGTAMSSNTSSTTSATRNTVAPAAIGAQRVNAAVNYMYTGNIGNDFSAVAPSPTSTGISTGLISANKLDFVYTSNGNIMFNATANQTVEVFNAVGQLIVSRKTIEGLNTISVLQKGIVLVKVGDKVSKVIL